MGTYSMGYLAMEMPSCRIRVVTVPQRSVKVLELSQGVQLQPQRTNVLFEESRFNSIDSHLRSTGLGVLELGSLMDSVIVDNKSLKKELREA